VNAQQHTRKMLRWLTAVGIERFDLALRQTDATMIWHRSKSLGQLPLAWARALNVRQAEVYVRPARSEAWPVVFLDDVELSLAVAITGKYAALAVATSTSGEHLGRLAGFRNWKRSGVWVNTVASSETQPWDPRPALCEPPALAPRHQSFARQHGGIDTSPSGQDWAWTCSLLESGDDPDSVYRRLVARVRPRRGADAERYARRTVDQAVSRL